MRQGRVNTAAAYFHQTSWSVLQTLQIWWNPVCQLLSSLIGKMIWMLRAIAKDGSESFLFRWSHPCYQSPASGVYHNKQAEQEHVQIPTH